MPELHLAAQHRHHLEVDQLWSCERLAGQSSPSGFAIRSVVAERDNKNAGVNDDHGHHAPRLPRPQTTRSRQTGFRRAQGTSSKVGIAASSINLLRRYSCND